MTYYSKWVVIHPEYSNGDIHMIVNEFKNIERAKEDIESIYTKNIFSNHIIVRQISYDVIHDNYDYRNVEIEIRFDKSTKKYIVTSLETKFIRYVFGDVLYK